MNTETKESNKNLNIKLLDRQKDVKLKFLQDQNLKLREQINDLEENLKINKESLSLLIKNQKEIDPLLHKNLNTNDLTVFDESNESNNLIKHLYKIIDNLSQENVKHLENINKLIIDKNNAQTKAFVNELISDETQKGENELIRDLRDRILFLQKLVNQREKSDEKKIDNRMEDVIICKTIIENPNEQIMKIYKDFQATKLALTIIYRKYNRLKNEQKDLIQLNYSLFLELNKIREVAKCNENKIIISKEPLNDNLSVITYYKEFLKETGDQSKEDDELSPLNSPLPQKINLNKKQENKVSKIPKLDLTKAKKIQETNAKRVIPQKADNKSVEQGNISIDLIEKIKRLENELLRVKKLLQFEVVNHNRMTEICEKALMEKDEFAEKCEKLRLSQIEYEKKWEKIYHHLSFYRDFYFNNIFQMYKEQSMKKEEKESHLNQLIGLDTVQNRLNQENNQKPLNLLEISLKTIEFDFADKSKKIMEESNSAIPNEKNFPCFTNKKYISVSSFENLEPINKLSNSNYDNIQTTINKLPYSSYKKPPENQNFENKNMKLKKRMSKSQIIMPLDFFKKAEQDKKKEKNQQEGIKNLSKSQHILDYGRKMMTTIKKRLISPLSKSINEEKDLIFLSKNNLDFSKKKNLSQIVFNEELFI